MEKSFVTYKLSRASLCPTCGTYLDGASALENLDDPIMPKVGDISVCLYCGTVFEFGKDNQLSKLSEEALAALPMREEDRRLVAKARRVWKERLQEVFAPRMGEGMQGRS